MDLSSFKNTMFFLKNEYSFELINKESTDCIIIILHLLRLILLPDPTNYLNPIGSLHMREKPKRRKS